MAAQPKYSLTGYELRRRMLKGKPIILVEGTSDQLVFKRLIEYLEPTPNTDIIIDSAEMLEAPEDPGIGNREKVERVCLLYDRSPSTDSFVGFVDREYRGLLFNDRIQTNASIDHYCSGSLVWSCGHSIENYLLNPQTLTSTFQHLVPSVAAPVLIENYENEWGRMIRTALALSIAAHATEKTQITSRSIQYNMLSFDSSMGIINLREWENVLSSKMRLDVPSVNSLVDEFKSSYSHLESMDLPPEREAWYCHGHIGFKLAWSTFERIIALREEASVLHAFRGTAERIRLNATAIQWGQHARSGSSSYPTPVFDRVYEN